jgi:hypothetical protein
MPGSARRPARGAGASSAAGTVAILAMLSPLGSERFKATFGPAAPPYCEIAHTAPHEQRRQLVRLGDRDARPREEGQCRLCVPALLLILEDAAPVSFMAARPRMILPRPRGEGRQRPRASSRCSTWRAGSSHRRGWNLCATASRAAGGRPSERSAGVLLRRAGSGRSAQEYLDRTRLLVGSGASRPPRQRRGAAAHGGVAATTPHASVEHADGSLRGLRRPEACIAEMEAAASLSARWVWL